MKQSISPLRLPAALLLVGSCILVPAVQAQQPIAKVSVLPKAETLREANSHVNAAHVVWERVQHINPIAEANPDQWQARAVEEARQQGMTEEQAQLAGKAERREAVRSKQGRVINSTLDMVRVGDSVLSKIEHTNLNYQSRSLEFSDGKISLFAQLKSKGKSDNSPVGTLTSDPKDILRLSMSGDQVARFLLGIPLDQNFGRANPALSDQGVFLTSLPNGDISLEQAARKENKKLINPVAFTFSKEGLYPNSFEKFDIALQVEKNNKIKVVKAGSDARVTATDYKQYENGIWFPSHVTVKWPNATTEYTLVSAEFNDNVDPAELKLPSLKVTDSRFGSGPQTVVYNVKSGTLPSDEQVKALIEDDRQAMAAKQEGAQATARNPKMAALPVAAGLALISFGGWLLNANRRKNS